MYGDKVIELTHVDYSNQESKIVKDGETSVYQIAKALSTEQMADLLDDWLNSYNGDYSRGKKIGELMRTTHRTLQGSLYRFVLGILVGLSDQDYTDPRNEVAVENAKKIKRMLEDGTIKLGYMI